MKDGKTFGRLREKIKQKYGTLLVFSSEIGMNKATFSKKMNGQSDFTRSEIETICTLLEISADDVGGYFFYKQ